ncbi:hypothetical protein H9P43_001379 [Blastocladiella emersonii ATCC 22665]|nr:hypothetical protein H9P43_001379 [Blastocladiella emersonii ATCC 22665]
MQAEPANTQQQTAAKPAGAPPLSIVQNSVVATVAGYGVGLVTGAYKRLPVAPTAAGMAFMWGSIGLGFFSSRYMINRAVATAELGEGSTAQDRHALLASIGAGAGTGAVSTLLVYGRRGLVPATLVAAGVAGLGQATVTWARHTRQEVLLWKHRQEGDEERKQPSFLESLRAQANDVMVNTKWLPVRMLTDAEFLASLDDQVARNGVQIAKYEAAMARLRARIAELEAAQDEGGERVEA